MSFAAVAPGNTSTPVHEIVGIYETDEELDIAITDLIDAGFSSSQFGLMARKNAVREQLNEVYREVSSLPEAPLHQLEFVGKRATHSNIPLRLGGLGSLKSSPNSGEVVASRSVLLGAALAVVTGKIKRFPSGIAALTKLTKTNACTESQPIQPIAEALVDDRLLLMVSEPSARKMSMAKEVLELSDSLDEGIISVEASIQASQAKGSL